MAATEVTPGLYRLDSWRITRLSRLSAGKSDLLLTESLDEAGAFS